jgi:hypothetical protein
MRRYTLGLVCLGVSAAVLSVPAQAAKQTTLRPKARIKLVLLAPKLVNNRLVLSSSDPVQFKFRVVNNGNITLHKDVVMLGPRAIFVSSKPAAKLVSDSTGGSAQWRIKTLKAKSRKTFVATVQFDFSQSQYSAFSLQTWGTYRSARPSDVHLGRVPVVLQQ